MKTKGFIELTISNQMVRVPFDLYIINLTDLNHL